MTSAPHVAVIGAGPAGFFAAADLLKRLPDARVDLLERLFAPYGLVRYGVAPDHPKTRSVEKVFAQVLADPRVRYMGGVEVGAAVAVADLRARYSALIFTHGALRSRMPGLPGETLPGVWGAAEFVAWYNGHPDFQELRPDLSHETAVVVGNGNVAMDCARILAQDPEHLATTDIADHALAALRASRVRRVWVVGRRGPAQAAFTPPEVSELREFPGLRVVVDPVDLEMDDATRAELATPDGRLRQRVVDLLSAYAAEPLAEAPREIRFRFHRSPVELLGGTQLTGMRLAVNRLEGEPGARRAVDTGAREDMACGLALFSIGYTGSALPGLPFDARRGVVPNQRGRVEGLPGAYVAGWIKRGPQGVIGTNKKDAAETVDALLEDWQAGVLRPVPAPDTVPGALDADGWRALEREERQRGEREGRPRVKFTRRPPA